MNLEKLQKNLIEVARAHPPSDAVPFAFERRIMAALGAPAPAPIDPWAAWSRSLWRAAAPAVGIMCMMSLWTFLSVEPASISPDSMAADLESAVMAPLDQIEDAW